MNFKQLKMKVFIYYIIIKQIIINFLMNIYIIINEYQQFIIDNQF